MDALAAFFGEVRFGRTMQLIMDKIAGLQIVAFNLSKESFGQS
jgi:hypothetical protein